jgi:hypothetical protein
VRGDEWPEHDVADGAGSAVEVAARPAAARTSVGLEALGDTCPCAFSKKPVHGGEEEGERKETDTV